MKRLTWIATFFFICLSTTYADEPSTVEQGAQGYDWQTCVNSKSAQCLNSCATSPDINCKDTCLTTAKDKCITQGVIQP